jgi:hypothetical protein
VAGEGVHQGEAHGRDRGCQGLLVDRHDILRAQGRRLGLTPGPDVRVIRRKRP